MTKALRRECALCLRITEWPYKVQLFFYNHLCYHLSMNIINFVLRSLKTRENIGYFFQLDFLNDFIKATSLQLDMCNELIIFLAVAF